MRVENDRELQRLEEEMNNLRVLKTAGIAYKDFLEDEIMRVVGDPNIPDPSLEMMERLERRVIKDSKKVVYRKRITNWKAKAMKIVACFTVMSVVLMAALVTVRASRANIANYLIATFAEFAEIHYDAAQNAKPPIGWENEYYPTWLPDNWKFMRIALEAQADIVWYEDESGHQISFSVLQSEQKPSFDTEKMMVEQIEIQGRKAHLYATRDKREYTLILPVEDNVLIISGEIAYENIITMGNHLKID